MGKSAKKLILVQCGTGGNNGGKLWRKLNAFSVVEMTKTAEPKQNSCCRAQAKTIKYSRNLFSKHFRI